jgi:uncharacterized membrane protein HdeD (DUF308 family)
MLKMSTSIAGLNLAPRARRSWDSPRRIVVVRALLALVWAAGLIAAIGDRVPSTNSDVPIAAALLLASYPLIDVIASLFTAARRGGGSSGVLRVNAAIGALAVVAIAATAFGSDAGAALAAFGAWAAVSGAIQLGVALRDRTQGRRVLMLVSGGLSTIAGLNFVATSRTDDPRLAVLGGYMALGAVLFLLSAWRGQSTPRPAR